MPRNQPWIQRYPSEELAGPTRILTCEEFGLLQRLRDYAGVGGGIPNDEEYIWKLARTFHLSKYKLRKLWPTVKNFFTVRDDCLFYEDDEEKRTAQLVMINKRRHSGHLGAEVRWGNRSEPGLSGAGNPDGNAIASAIGENLAKHGEPESESYSNGGYPPPPHETGAGGGGGADQGRTKGKDNKPVEPPPEISDREYQAIRSRAAELGMAAPRRRLAGAIRSKWPREAPLEQVCAELVRWPGQEHCGMWLGMERSDFTAERDRQAAPAPRKRTAAEDINRRLMESARARDATR